MGMVLSSIEPTGFAREWPDAIECRLPIPNVSDKYDYTPFIFYYNGARGNVTRGGLERTYFLVGDYNYYKKDLPVGANVYIPHELWFRNKERTIIELAALGVNEEQMHIVEDDIVKQRPIAIRALYNPIYGLNGTQRGYIMGFIPQADCGGSSMDKIQSSGHAFYFARH